MRAPGPGLLVSALLPLAVGCASPLASPLTKGARAGGPSPTAHLAPTTGPARAEGAPREALAWADLDADTLARAKRERKYVVLDGSAEWCHWCHVMEATTYHDPAVRALLDRYFVSVKVDVDARPDIEERYGDWGWPATVIFSPDATELGKYRGYIPPEKFAEILEDVVASRVAERGARAALADAPAISDAPMPAEELAWIARFTEVELGEYWDAEQGGWGHTQKAPIASNNAWALARARSGDAERSKRALFTLDQQAKLVDPVWGGIYQYSAGTDWEHPHFEKLMPYQAGALDNYADAYALTKDPRYLTIARKMQGYIEAFLLGKDGGFYVTQDADLNAHDATKSFMSGQAYYAMDDAHRRAAGIPRVDAHEYGKDNGLAIAAYVRLYEATGDLSVLATAERAAARVLATHASPRGGIGHDVNKEEPPKVLHLADNAAMAMGLARLYEATKKPEHLASAVNLADFMLRDLEDPRGGGFFASTLDPDAIGVFRARRTPFEDNVTAIRALARLATADHTRRATYVKAIQRTLRALATPEEIKGRGRMLGDFLLAMEETRGMR